MKEMYCPKCKEKVFPSGPFHESCGSKLVDETPKELFCRKCRKEIGKYDAYCPYCGNALKIWPLRSLGNLMTFSFGSIALLLLLGVFLAKILSG
jgi:hypothetical protein